MTAVGVRADAGHPSKAALNSGQSTRSLRSWFISKLRVERRRAAALILWTGRWCSGSTHFAPPPLEFLSANARRVGAAFDETHSYDGSNRGPRDLDGAMDHLPLRTSVGRYDRLLYCGSGLDATSTLKPRLTEVF